MARALVVDSRRLFAAADTLLEAMQSPGGLCGLMPRSPDDVSGDAPPCHAFSRTELVEAASMLFRLGFTGHDLRPAPARA